MPRTPTPRASLYGRNIRDARIDACLTQEQLARAIVDTAITNGERLTLDASAVSRWEGGLFEPSLRYRPHIAAVLDADVRFLFPAIPKDWAA